MHADGAQEGGRQRARGFEPLRLLEVDHRLLGFLIPVAIHIAGIIALLVERLGELTHAGRAEVKWRALGTTALLLTASLGTGLLSATLATTGLLLTLTLLLAALAAALLTATGRFLSEALIAALLTAGEDLLAYSERGDQADIEHARRLQPLGLLEVDSRRARLVVPGAVHIAGIITLVVQRLLDLADAGRAHIEHGALALGCFLRQALIGLLLATAALLTAGEQIVQAEGIEEADGERACGLQSLGLLIIGGRLARLLVPLAVDIADVIALLVEGLLDLPRASRTDVNLGALSARSLLLQALVTALLTAGRLALLTLLLSLSLLTLALLLALGLHLDPGNAKGRHQCRREK